MLPPAPFTYRVTRRAFLQAALLSPLLARAAQCAAPAKFADPSPVWEIPLRVVQIVDSQGNAEFARSDFALWTPVLLAAHMAEVNGLFAPAGIKFTFDAKTAIQTGDFETRRDDFLFVDFDPVFSGPELKNHDKKPPEKNRILRQSGLQKIANEKPHRLTLITRRGSEWRWDTEAEKWQFGVGYSRGGDATDGNPATLTGTNVRIWAHELGHEMGLPHTSRDAVDFPSALVSADALSAACQAYLDAGGSAAHPEYGIDGDVEAGVFDTLPDPGLGFWQATDLTETTITLRLKNRPPLPVLVSRSNIMAALPGAKNFTPGQIAVMRRTAEKWVRRVRAASPVRGDRA